MSRFQGLYVFAGVKTFSSVTCMINKLFKDETVGFFLLRSVVCVPFLSSHVKHFALIPALLCTLYVRKHLYFAAKSYDFKEMKCAAYRHKKDIQLYSLK